MDSKISNVYNKNPKCLIENEYSIEEAKTIFLKEKFDIIPVIDRNFNIVDILFWDKLFNEKKHNRIMI